jgi:hypothetical protein
VNKTILRLRSQLFLKSVKWKSSFHFKVVRQNLFIVIRERFYERRAMFSVVFIPRLEIGRLGPKGKCGPHRDDGEPKYLGDLSQQWSPSCTCTIDLVHEKQGWDSKSPERPH